MKKYIQFFLAAMVMFFATTALAQNDKTKGKPKMPKLTIEQRATRNADSLKARLKLTDAQYAKVIPVNIEFYQTKQDLMKQQKADTLVSNQGKYKEQIKLAHQKRKKAIDDILTKEQKDAFKAWKKEHPTRSKVNKSSDDDDDYEFNER